MKRKADIIMIILIIAVAGLIWVFLRLYMTGEGALAVVSTDGRIMGKYSLAQDNIISIPDKGGGYNLLVISGGVASVTDADCRDKLCVKQKSISLRGESIICLPHKLVIQIENGGERNLDGITN